MGVFNVLALAAELGVLACYVLVPVAHGPEGRALLTRDLAAAADFRQSLAASGALTLARLGLFIYVRHASKRAPATRGFVFAAVLLEAVILALIGLQVLVQARDPMAFRAYRRVPWGGAFCRGLWGLALGSGLLQVIYILRLNKSRGRLADESLLRDVLHRGLASPSTTSASDARLALWRNKWAQLVQHLKRRRRGSTTFEAIVRLYAQRDGAVDRLAVVYDRNPAELEFYLPQLCSFLLLGAFQQSPQLCMILLDKCSASHVFAHRVLWYFQSFCLWNPAFAAEESHKRIQMLIDEVSARGVEPARAIDNPAVAGTTSLPTSTDGENKEAAATKDNNRTLESDALLPVRDEQYHTFPPEHTPVMDLECGGASHSNPFQLETTFLNALANISSNLRTVSVALRNEMLRKWLIDLENQFLPSNSLYLPVGNPQHRLKRIHVQESFTFSTRERVPFLLCAEVVDYTTTVEKKVTRRRSFFQSRRFTINLWDKGGHAVANQSAVSSADRPHHLASPEEETLGFWSESKPHSSPRMRSISQHLTTSIAQQGEIFTGFFDSFVKKTPLTKNETSASYSHIKYTNREALLPDGESTDRTATSCPVSPVGLSVSRPGDDSFTEPSKVSLTIDTSNGEKSRASSRRNEDLWSPRSEDVPLSPQSPASMYSPPSLARCDSTDMFLRTLSERDSKLAEEEDGTVPPLSFGRTDIPTVIFKERWAEKEGRIQVNSPWGSLPGWRLLPVIVKSNDDLRQEQIASQLIRQFYNVFEEAKLPVFVRPYDVIAITSTSGLVEAIADTISIDSLKRNDREYTTLLDFFTRHFGDESTSEFRAARNNFVSSMAAYSIICYLLQIKDRHNGNILLDAEGHIIHIDFGFMLANNPGNVAFEQAPFKLTAEFVELMGGPRSAAFRRFRSLCVRSFLVARKYRHRFVLLVEMMLNGNEHLPCFAGDPRGTVERFAARFQPELDINACEDFVHALIDASLDNWRTKWYDKYQRWIVGVF